MMNFFKALNDHKLLVAHIPFLDWIFTEKFDKTRWNNKNRIQAFTKLLYKYPGLTEKSRVYTAQKNIVFPVKYKGTKPIVYMSDGGSYGRDWIRHIRNAIAHGHCLFIERRGHFFLELKDYSNSECTRQTSYLFIPIDYLLRTLKDYDELDKRWEKR